MYVRNLLIFYVRRVGVQKYIAKATTTGIDINGKRFIMRYIYGHGEFLKASVMCKARRWKSDASQKSKQQGVNAIKSLYQEN